MTETIRSSPPSTPSSTTSDEVDQLDELHFPSSPNTSPPRIHELHKAKMGRIIHAPYPTVLIILVYFGRRNLDTSIASNWWYGWHYTSHIA